jgi:hypothetical protein
MSCLLVWRHCHVDACWLQILFTGKMPPAPEKAICMPESVIDEYRLETTGRVGDTPIHESQGDAPKCETVKVLAFRPADWMS